MSKLEVGQFQERNSPPPHELAVHAVRGNGRPMCGRWYEEWDNKPMDFVTWQGDGEEVTCLHHSCRRMT